MKTLKKNLFTVGLAFSMILGVAFSFVPQEASARMNPEIDGGEIIYCNCMTFGNKCKSRGSNARCAQSEPGGNIQCSAYNGNC